MKLEQKNESLTNINHNMNETHGFSKQYNVCINEIISFHLWVVFGYLIWIFCERFQKQSRWSNYWRLVTSGVQRSGDVRGNCLIVCPLPNSNIEQQHMASLLMDIRCLQCHHMTSYLCLQTNILAKCVDTTCILFYMHSPYYLLHNVSL